MSDVICMITGRVTPIPKRGPRSQYVNKEARDLRARLSQAESLVQSLASDVGFTPDARRRFRRLLGSIGELTHGADFIPSPPDRRRPDLRASVRLSHDVTSVIDAMSGPSRTAKVEQLLLEALAAREDDDR